MFGGCYVESVGRRGSYEDCPEIWERLRDSVHELRHSPISTDGGEASILQPMDLREQHTRGVR